MKFLILFLFLFSNTLAWWKNTILYEIYIWSFKDSDGNGIGDLNGITQNVDHFSDLSIDTIYVTPFFKSPMADTGYDISNYTDIDPLFGTMADFERLIAAMKERGIKMIGDFVINHSSDQHPWFEKSINRIHPYTDFYVWADAKGYDANGKEIPPNNWMSLFAGSAWEWNDKRKQFYLHQFGIQQPDFNLRNKHLKKELKKIIKFWFDKGVSGLRLDATKHYMEDELLRDEPAKDPKQKYDFKYNDLNHIYTTNLWELYEFIHEIRQYIDSYNENPENDHERILIVEAYADLNKTMAYYNTNDYRMTNFPLNFLFLTLINAVPAQQFHDLIYLWLQNMPVGAVPNWEVANHDMGRVDRKLGVEYMDIITTAIMTLPGVACIYYGEEIGMQTLKIRDDQKRDVSIAIFNGITRDNARTPMQWDDSLNAGFSTSREIWLPVHPNYWAVNVKTEKNKKYSRYHMFKALSSIRKTSTMKHGHFKSYILSKWVYSFVRFYKKHQTYVTILNLGTETEMFDLHEAIPNLPSTLQVVTASLNGGYKSGDKIQNVGKFPRFFIMRPSSSVVLTSGKYLP